MRSASVACRGQGCRRGEGQHAGAMTRLERKAGSTPAQRAGSIKLTPHPCCPFRRRPTLHQPGNQPAALTVPALSRLFHRMAAQASGEAT